MERESQNGDSGMAHIQTPLSCREHFIPFRSAIGISTHAAHRRNAIAKAHLVTIVGRMSFAFSIEPITDSKVITVDRRHF
jgi:hypothetical protein